MKRTFFFIRRVGLSFLVSLLLFISCAEDSPSYRYELSLSEIRHIIPCPDNNHPHIIDLGLSVKWACCNVGASSPIDYGGYYAWGETEEKTTYDWSTYKCCNGSETSLTKYCTNSSYGTVDNKKQLALSDDVARVKWGGSWRMPTLDEIKELMNNTTCTWTSVNGVCGMHFRSRTNGNSIFLPAAGIRWGGELYYAGSSGDYWSSTLYEGYPSNAYYFYLLFDRTCIADNRNSGRSVRPVVGAFLNVYPVSLSLPCEASSAVFNVSTDQDYTINVSDSWITATASTDKQIVTVTATANTGAERTATVTIRGGRADEDHSNHASEK